MQLHMEVSDCNSLLFLEVGLMIFTITQREIFCVLYREKYSKELIKICPGSAGVRCVPTAAKLNKIAEKRNEFFVSK